MPSPLRHLMDHGVRSQSRLCCGGTGHGRFITNGKPCLITKPLLTSSGVADCALQAHAAVRPGSFAALTGSSED